MTLKQSVGYHSIVAAITPGQTDQPAALRAANVANKLHSQVTLVRIFAPSEASPEAQKSSEQTTTKLRSVHPEIVLEKSAPGSWLELIRLSDEVSGDLIVLDNQIYSVLAPLLLESNKKSCDHGDCDALIVHSKSYPPSQEARDYQHILVAVDLNDKGLMTIYKAVRMAKRYQARLTLLNVVEQFDPNKQDAAAVKDLRMRGLEAFISVIEGLEVEKAVILTSGDAYHAITDYTIQQQIDLAVIGSHEFLGLCVLLGETARNVFKKTECDILVVHE